jgi:hypothetical protein
MSFFNWFTGKTAEPIEALGNAVDKVFTSDEERMQAQAVLNKLALQPSILQAELNKIEAQHRSVFVAGWRPAVGWICALGLGFAFLGNPLLERFVGGNPVNVPLDIEKVQGKSK